MNICLIPAAGFGKRVGGPPAKEMLMDRESQRPLIDWSIELALESGLKPLIITRQDKVSLISHIESKWRSKGADVFLIEESKEWPESILKSESKWGDINLMLLPDTRFAPRSLLRDLIRDCERGSDLSFAFFRTNESLETWGVLDWSENKMLRICEKPHNLSSCENQAPWGLIAFQKKIGKKLFSDLLKSNQTHEWFQCEASYSLQPLTHFRDITRNLSDFEFEKP